MVKPEVSPVASTDTEDRETLGCDTEAVEEALLVVEVESSQELVVVPVLPLLDVFKEQAIKTLDRDNSRSLGIGLEIFILDVLLGHIIGGEPKTNLKDNR